MGEKHHKENQKTFVIWHSLEAYARELLQNPTHVKMKQWYPCVLLLLLWCHWCTNLPLLLWEVCLEMNVEELKYTFVPHKQTVEQNCNIKIPTEIWLCYLCTVKIPQPFTTNIISSHTILHKLKEKILSLQEININNLIIKHTNSKIITKQN
jgi:hypothetical protein